MADLTRIPTKAREVVMAREQGGCLRCSGPGAEWAHRRTRSVHDEHTMCPCNGVRLCTTCHQWCHHNPTAAVREGFMVSRHVAEPGIIPVESWYGTIWLHCDGGIDFTEESWRTNKERSTT
jgi:5-methylcytosine-specific restriction protein A